MIALHGGTPHPGPRIAIAAVLAVLLPTGCTFPDITIIQGSGGSGASTSSASTATGDGGATGSTTGSGGGVECNEDGDSALKEAPGCCTTPSECDCDDEDERAFPGQTVYFDTERKNSTSAATKFDFDCDGVSDPKYKKGTCATLNSCNNFPPGTYFDATPAVYGCGVMGNTRYCIGEDNCGQTAAKLGCR